MEVVILCGGKGTRLWPYTQELPKPLISIGGKPILYHVMKIYSHYGYKRFILCLGYLGEKIKEYFQSPENKDPDWDITFVDTGIDTETGERLKQVEKYIEGDIFFTTYADGVADIDINKLLEFHKSHNGVATLTTVRPQTHFGVLNTNKNNQIKNFIEKPVLDIWVNGGFFVFNKKIFDFIKNKGNEVLEKDVFGKLTNEGQLYAFKHDSFWRCMDTYKDTTYLNESFTNGGAKWMIWKN